MTSIGHEANIFIIDMANICQKVLFSAMLLFVASVFSAHSQVEVDKTLVVLNDGARTELITLSDVMWQMALQPGTELDPPDADDMQRALRTLIDQRLFALEAERLPRNPPTEQEVAAKIAETVAYFRSPAEFEARLRRVGFRSINDEAFQRLMSQRLAIDKYIDFRFGSFVVVTAEEEQRFFQEQYRPDFRRQFPGLLLPNFEDKRAEIREMLIARKTGQAMERFLEQARERVEITELLKI
ncbi:MAG: hypothetical protein IPM50_09785 [Acidobacteriota bacterium]|nr:MAG: hypothetical protein IPM50_09785 [Acidobacteriota bacterium]